MAFGCQIQSRVNLANKKYNNKGAVKIKHHNAHIPAPTKELIEELASGIHCAVAGSATIDMNEKHEPFEHLPDNIRSYWIEGARCAYAIIAIYGGGEVQPINNAK